MFQFAEFPFITELFRNPRFKDCMRLAEAYRSLPRPYSALEPSHPLVGVTLPTFTYTRIRNITTLFC